MNKELPQTKDWLVYLLKCADGTFYTGITNNLPKRLAAHNAGLGAKYTRGRIPVELIGKILAQSHSHALQLEIEIKKRPKSEKTTYFLRYGTETPT
jgi:putative endonuclease